MKIDVCKQTIDIKFAYTSEMDESASVVKTSKVDGEGASECEISNGIIEIY